MKSILDLEDDIHVVSQVESLPKLYAVIERYTTDVILLGGELVGRSTESVFELVCKSPAAKLIIQIAETEKAHILALYRGGVRGLVPRSLSPDLLVKCVRKISGGETWINNQSIGWLLEAFRSESSGSQLEPSLSGKQLSIINCIARGMRNKEIAYHIGTTEQVVKNYLRAIYGKVGAGNRLGLVLYCLQHDLVDKSLREGLLLKAGVPPSDASR